MVVKSLGFSLIAILLLAGCATGSAIVTGTVRAPAETGQVSLYLDPPAEFEVIDLLVA